MRYRRTVSPSRRVQALFRVFFAVSVVGRSHGVAADGRTFSSQEPPPVGIESVELTWTRVWEDFSGIGYRFRGGGLVGF
ncbi:MAG: hypothetical protein ACOX8C_18875, partial [Saccharomonospora viridis]|uniref:hypothetical protein n=1 Tax=Saccharomonospora viridis TaxID=1852 RepID=UPI003D940B5C